MTSLFLNFIKEIKPKNDFAQMINQFRGYLWWDLRALLHFIPPPPSLHSLPSILSLLIQSSLSALERLYLLPIPLWFTPRPQPIVLLKSAPRTQTLSFTFVTYMRILNLVLNSRFTMRTWLGYFATTEEVNRWGAHSISQGRPQSSYWVLWVTDPLRLRRSRHNYSWASDLVEYRRV